MRDIMLVFARNWWLWLIRGIAAVIFGIFAIIWPDVTVTVLVIMFGVYALVDGGFTIGSAIIGATQGRRWGMPLLIGLSSVLLGALTLIWPGVTVFVLLALIAAWAFIVGVLQIIAAIRLRAVIEGEWLMILSGVLAILIAAILIISPIGSIVTLAIIAGVFAIFFGVDLIAFSLRLRRWGQEVGGSTA